MIEMSTIPNHPTIANANYFDPDVLRIELSGMFRGWQFVAMYDELAQNRTGGTRQDAINQQGIPLGLQVIEEDRRILEQVQRGVSIADRQAVLGEEEIRIAAFHRGYDRMLGQRTALTGTGQ